MKPEAVVNKRGSLRAKVSKRQQKFEAANAKVTARAGRNLVFAVASGLFFGAVFVISLVFLEPLMLVLIIALSAISIYELATAFRIGGLRVPRIGVILGSIMILIGTWFWGADGMLWGMFFGSSLLLLWRLSEGIFAKQVVHKRTMLADLSAGIFTLVYIPLLMGMAVLMYLSDQVNGKLWVFAIIMLCVVCDISAYIVGVTLGKHKMSPRISPNKTWEGFSGAALALLIAGTLTAVYLLQLPWWVGVLLGAAVLITATTGDLVESFIKRCLGVKDISKLLPGHGGMLDRLDSILPSIIPFYTVAILTGAV
nr:phosphatidate cytidylyltransferase [Canibacter zhuwentaonis]